MPGSSWTVVKFIEENSVEAVPTSWIKDNKHCLWPSLQYNKVIQAIRNNQEPDIDWPLYEITIFRNSTYENYMMARNKCKKAEDTSDLNSEISDGDTKRKSKRKIYSSSEEEEREEFSYRFLPTPPPLKDNNVTRKNNEIGQEVVTTHDTRSNTFAQSKVEPESDNESSPSLIIKKTNRVYDNYKARKSYKINPDLAIHNARNSVCAQSNVEDESSQNSPLIVKKSNPTNVVNRSLHTQQNSFQDNFVNPEKENFQLTNSMKCACKFCPTYFEMQNKNEIYFKEIIRHQNYFKAQLWQTCEDIRDLKNTGLNQANGIQRQESIFYSFTLPIETEEQLEEVEEFLKNQANFEASVTQASHTGGKHSYEFIKRNLNQLLSNKLAEKYSWYGKKQKKKFHELKLAEMLIAAGEAYNASFTKKELEEAVQKWLRRAKERADASEKKLANQIMNNL